jgi:hypothetical protein
MAKGETPYLYADYSYYDSYEKHQRYKKISLEEADFISQTKFIYISTKDQGEELTSYPVDIFDHYNIERTDPILVSIVETLGSDMASGKYAHLHVEEIPDGIQYKIDDYDGIEELITKDDDDWIIANNNDPDPEAQRQIENLWATIKPNPIPDPDLTFTQET